MVDRISPPEDTRRAAEFMQRHGTMVAVALGCALALILVVILEGACLLVEHNAKSRACETAYTPEDFVQYDADLGARPLKDARVIATRKCTDGSDIFQSRYTIDEHGRRVTPGDETADRPLFMLFFGCSFIFGEGVNDDQTLPYFLARDAPCYTPYNYAFIGYGPQQMLAMLERGQSALHVKQPRGIAIYGYMGEPGVGQIDRAIGSLHIHGWAKHFPYYYLDDTGALRRDRDFASGRRVRSLAYSALRRSAIVRVFGINHPLWITEDHVRLTAAVIQESAKAFRRVYNSDAFYVVSFPHATPKENRALIDLLTAAGVRCLDYSAIPEFSQPGYRIEGDEHPSARWNERLAALIARDLGIRGTNCATAPR